MKIAIIGTGYVGLVSGVCFSDIGHDVVCVDKSADKIATLKRGLSPIYEPGLEAMMASNVAAGRLSFSQDLAEAVKGAEAVFIAVGTPSNPVDGSADLTYIHQAAAEIADALEDYAVVVTKSTVPVGTNQVVRRIIAERRPYLAFDVASNPEFLREGAAIKDFMEPDRVVVGVGSERAARVMRRIYAPLQDGDATLLVTDIASAEMIKYAANAFLATKITFINEVAALCEKVQADVRQVSTGIGLDSRIGGKFLEAGPGYGGSCFPKDTRAFARTGAEQGAPQTIIETVINANEAAKNRVVDKVSDLFDGDLAGARIAVLGVTFKPDTDDMREAPSLTILPALSAAGAALRVTDPQGEAASGDAFAGAVWCDDAYEAAAGADAVVLLTHWSAFRGLDLGKLAAVMREPRMVDLRGVYAPDAAIAAGFTDYVGVGARRHSASPRMTAPVAAVA